MEVLSRYAELNEVVEDFATEFSELLRMIP